MLLAVEASVASRADVAEDTAMNAHVTGEVGTAVEHLAAVGAHEAQLAVDELSLFTQLQIVGLLSDFNAFLWACIIVDLFDLVCACASADRV